MLTQGKWHIEGEDDFDVNNGEATGIIIWDPSDDETEVGVTLACDPDDLKSAALATEHLNRIRFGHGRLRWDVHRPRIQYRYMF